MFNMKNEKEQSTDSTSLKFAGREFPDTPDGRKQLEEYGQQLASLVGRQSNEVGQARKSLAKYQRIESQLPEPIKMVLESDDASPDAKLLAQYMYQEKLQAAQRDDSSHRDEWYQRAAELVLEDLPELKDSYDADIVDALLRKHSIHEREDPLGEARKLLEPKVKRKAAPKVEEDGHVSVDGSARSSRAGSSEEKPSGGATEDVSYLLS
jgi:hypothetical protein